ncbi:MAG: ABC transporter ATP-binding protein [Phycisphaerales bacterium]|nr:MAG: ABC transporter ATP-binding protein [Phycisphaerales bacterium]
MPDDQVAALQIENLAFRYRPGEAEVVRVGSLVVGAGEAVLLTGASGRGKSTLLQLVAGLLEPSEGVVRVRGQDIHELRGAKRDTFRGRQIGMIFQTFNLLTGFSASENVMAAMHFAGGTPAGEQRGRAVDTLSKLGLDRVDAPVEELSVGQQQRVAVARAVVNRPALVLADEPTASLDPPRADEAMDLIRRACAEAGAALVCTSHDPRMADRFERRVGLDELAGAAV